MPKDAWQRLRDVNALPYSKLDEFERQTIEIFKEIECDPCVSAANMRDLRKAHASLVASVRDHIRFMNRWVYGTTGAWAGTVVGLMFLASMSRSVNALPVTTLSTLAFVFMCIVRVDRWRTMKKSIGI